MSIVKIDIDADEDDVVKHLRYITQKVAKLLKDNALNTKVLKTQDSNCYGFHQVRINKRK